MIKKMTMIIGIVSLLLMPTIHGAFYDDVYIYLDSSGFDNGDHKILLALDTDSTGKVIDYFSMEFEGSDDVKIHERGSDAPSDYQEGFFAGADSIDFVVFAIHNTNGGDYDTATFTMKVYDGGATATVGTPSTSGAGYNDAIIVIWTISTSAAKPTLVAWKRASGGGALVDEGRGCYGMWASVMNWFNLNYVTALSGGEDNFYLSNFPTFPGNGAACD